MIVVLDASAAIELILGRPYSQKFEKIITEADTIVSPDLFISEICNVFWKYYNYENLPIEHCESAIDKCIDLVDEFIETISLYKEAFSFSTIAKHPVYDSMYLITARRNNAFLLTTDNKLIEVARIHSIKYLEL